MPFLPPLQLLFLTLSLWISRTIAQTSSLSVLNNCTEAVFVGTASANGNAGSVHAEVQVPVNATTDLDVTAGWIGWLLFGTGCTSSGATCTTGGGGWTGITPFSTALLNYSETGTVQYRIQMTYGFNVGVKIQSTNEPNCQAFSCDGIGPDCTVPGPDGSCYSPCCATAADCAGGVYHNDVTQCPVSNVTVPPNSDYYIAKCPNAWSSLSAGDKDVVAGCPNANILVTLCPGYSSDFTIQGLDTTTSGSSSLPSTSSTASSASTTASSSTTPIAAAAAAKHTSHAAVAAGVTVGVVLACALAALAGILFVRRGRRQSSPTEEYPKTEMREERVEPVVVQRPPLRSAASDEQSSSALSADTHSPSPGPTSLGAASTSLFPPNEKRPGHARSDTVSSGGSGEGSAVTGFTSLLQQTHAGNELASAQPPGNTSQTSFTSEAPPEYED